MSVQEDYLADIADAIREKEGSTDPIPAAEFAERVRGIRTTEDLHLVDGQIIPAYKEYDTTGVAKFEFSSPNLATFLCLAMHSTDEGSTCVCARRLTDGTWEAQTIDSRGIYDFKPGVITEDGDYMYWAANPAGDCMIASDMNVILMA